MARAFDDVRRAQMLPMLGREVVEGEQRVAIPDQALNRLVVKLSCGQALSSRLTPAAIRPNERRDSAFRAAANAVSAATVTPGASPRAFSAALSRSSASLSLRGLLSAIHQTHLSVP